MSRMAVGAALLPITARVIKTSPKNTYYWREIVKTGMYSRIWVVLQGCGREGVAGEGGSEG